jgi:hypothetical protein
LTSSRPILFVDVDGVISLFGFADDDARPGRFHTVDGTEHHIDDATGRRLTALAERFELVWATGWEDRANEHLPRVLELETGELPTLRFGATPSAETAAWKLDEIDRYAGDRPAAWIDDLIDDRCREWAEARSAPTLLMATETAVGLSHGHVDRLLEWAERVGGGEHAQRGG